jgi:hypothetical protein
VREQWSELPERRSEPVLAAVRYAGAAYLRRRLRAEPTALVEAAELAPERAMPQAAALRQQVEPTALVEAAELLSAEWAMPGALVSRLRAASPTALVEAAELLPAEWAMPAIAS